MLKAHSLTPLNSQPDDYAIGGMSHPWGSHPHRPYLLPSLIPSSPLISSFLSSSTYSSTAPPTRRRCCRKVYNGSAVRRAR
ncbi:hypothetical protein GCM10010211_12380 [Streptomyces albospinus]|uniref:Uncharacterized protein n=1 Tax=Streptomyces albospinus TaxID=285515 RepID=A0ABQ2URX9_9ACTN|nr:hypothetical protein GCM10010211_12380 [Streptomyces albospinus]